ncbi:MAG: DUF3558 domain-containing protein [Pseudonocardiaceae bacterium]|nr:DUF3558 domain-containing protein [Pseudonocardiaceae bacterium]
MPTPATCGTRTRTEPLRYRVLISLLAAGSVAAVVTGCSQEQDGNASPAVSETSSSAKSNSKAPKVNNPLDASKYLSSPCKVLTHEQSQSLGATAPGKPRTTGAVAERAGPACSWGNRDTGIGFQIAFMTGNKGGLSDTYRGNKQGDFEYFEPTEVDGYPAVYADGTDERADGYCALLVGISDKLAILSGTSAYEGKQNSCGAAEKAASEALKTLKGGA